MLTRRGSDESPSATDTRTWALIAGGGTAGHVQPGVDIARALVSRGHPPSSVRFVGTRHGIETRLVPEAGFRLTSLPGRGIQRRLTVANLVAAWGLAGALLRALWIVGRHRPAVVVAMGGYAGAPCALAAVVMRVPLVVVEQNAVPGAANRLVARFARASAISHPGTDLPRATITGNPVRPEVLAVDRQRDRQPARQELGLAVDRKVLAVFGGSLGARRINLALLAALENWAGRTDLAVRHIVGDRDWDLVNSSLPELPDDGIQYQAVRYEQRMHLVLAAADLAVCRAGGTTVAELAATGLPGVLIPLPGAPGDHQTANARVLERAGGVVVVPDAELDGERMVAEVGALIGDPQRLESMSRAVATCGHRDAADRVAALIEEHASHG